MLSQLLLQAESGQTEYSLAWALIGGFMFLGLLMLVVPRPRDVELPRELQRRRQFAAKEGGPAPQPGKAALASAFQAAIAQRQQEQQQRK